jgi:hypothetical protein
VWWEKWYPLLVAAAVSIVARFVPPLYSAFPNVSSEVLSGALNIAAIFIGFIATVASILMSINSRAVQFMKRIGKFHLLMNFIWWSLRSSFLFLGVSIVLLMFKDRPADPLKWYLGFTWVFLGLWSLLSTYRAIDIAVILIQNSANED